MRQTASACAKVILCGEHAVVYGQPAIALPLSDVRVTATAEPAETLTFVLQDLNETFDLTQTHPITELAMRVCEALNVPPRRLLCISPRKFPSPAAWAAARQLRQP